MFLYHVRLMKKRMPNSFIGPCIKNGETDPNLALKQFKSAHSGMRKPIYMGSRSLLEISVETKPYNFNNMLIDEALRFLEKEQKYYKLEEDELFYYLTVGHIEYIFGIDDGEYWKCQTI